MTIEQVNQQALQLLARKARLLEELKQIDNLLGQLGAIQQFADAQAPAEAPVTE